MYKKTIPRTHAQLPILRNSHAKWLQSTFSYKDVSTVTFDSRLAEDFPRFSSVLKEYLLFPSIPILSQFSPKISMLSLRSNDRVLCRGSPKISMLSLLFLSIPTEFLRESNELAL